MSSEVPDILSGFPSAIEGGQLFSSASRSGSVKLRGGDSRKRIPSQFLESVSSHASLMESSGFLMSGSLVDDVVAPLELEQEIISQVETVSAEDDAVKRLAEFPADDIEIVTEERQHRTVQPPLPKDDIDLSSHLKGCLKSFTQDYTIVKRKYISPKTDKEATAEKRLPRITFDGDEEEATQEESLEDGTSVLAKQRGSLTTSFVDLKSSPADPLIKELLQFTPQEEIDETNAALRARDRCDNFFGLLSLIQLTTSSTPTSGTFDDPEFPIEKLTPPPPPSQHFGHRLLVKCLSLELELEIEPIFATIALYDTKVRKKISENFHFDLNSDATRKMLRNESTQPSIPTLARTAIFSITEPSHDIFIVIKLEKVLQQGEIIECAEPYMKDATEKMQDKAKQNAKWYCDRLGRYRMPFAWTAIHLLNIVNSAKNLRPMEEATANAQASDEGGSKNSTLEFKHGGSTRKCSLTEAELNMLSSFKPVTLTVSSFFKQESEKLKDEDLFKFLVDLKRPTSVLKKLKCIPGKMKLDISPCYANFPYCITPDLLKVKPYPDQRGRPTREIQEFPPRGVNSPHVIYRNMLYVYPQSINFSNKPGHSRNIAVKVQILDCEEPLNALPLIYGKSNGPEFVAEAYAAVTYHNKNPEFYEEIKIQLPTKLIPRHHLLFTFFHISCQRKQDLSPIETPIGYTWLPLLHSGRLRLGEITLPVATDKLPPHYSVQTADSAISGIKWVDGRRHVFSAAIHGVSTLHTLDRHLERFFNLCDIIDQPTSSGRHKLPDGAVLDDLEHELKKSVVALAQEASLQCLVSFLYVILNKLSSMLTSPPTIEGHIVNVGQYCFEAISTISSRLHQGEDLSTDSHLRNVLLATYSRYLFTVSPFTPSSGEGGDAPVNFQVGSHYATMTRSEKRVRPSIKKATFHISSSNPDLTIQEELYEPSSDSNFIRHSATRSSLVEQGIKPSLDANAVRSVSHKIFHEEVVLLFVVSSGNVKDVALQHAWFIFELITKSMALHLHHDNALNLERSQRFPLRYLDDLQRLVKLVTHEITSRFHRDYDFTERLNCSLAFFFSDLMSIMDRGFVLQMIHVYCQMVNDKIRGLLSSTPASLLMLRVALLRIICSHEHYVTLNLPFLRLPPPSPTPSITSTSSSFVSGAPSGSFSQYDLTDRFTRQHYLAGLILSDIRLSCELLEAGQPSMRKVVLYALTTLRHLMTSHDVDNRISQTPEIKHTVASLYVPLLSITVAAFPLVYVFSDAERSSNEDAAVSSSVASAIANPISTQISVNNSINDVNGMGVECTRTLLLCFLWLIKNTERSKLRFWWSNLPSSQLIVILDLLHISISCFELGARSESNPLIRNEQARTSLNRGTRPKDSKSRLQEAILGGSSARQEMLMRRRGDKSATISGVGSRDALRWRKDQTEWKQVKHGEKMRHLADDSHAARNLCAEITLIVMDALDLIVETSTELADAGNAALQILACSLRILLHIFSKRQSVAVLQHAFAVQRSIVAKFPELVFEEETEQCADLTLRLLEKCTSPNTAVRMHSAASLYMLMRHNFSMGNNFARVKMQITMSMSSLVGVTHDFDEDNLRRSLKTILLYTEADTQMEGTSFPEQVRDLVFNLHMILSDTVKMKAHQEDPEMLIDLMYRIAKGYQNSPDLRLTWLQNMAKQHSERKNQAEAGMCLLHCAALVAEYLPMIEYKSHLPTGCVSFQHISMNLLEESAVSDDIISPNADTVCTEKYFSTPGLTAILEQAAHTFVMAGLHEVVGMIYKILTPIYEHQKDYKKLSHIHGKLSESFGKISSQTGKRMFGTYFRVAFYGPLFGDLDREEFIYKEPAITKLPEISYRLETFYSQCFGADKVEMIKDSSAIDCASLDPDKAFIQITYVEPYFYDYEKNMKTSYFDRNFNIDKFVYATPFTKEGKSHGEMREQCKRKTFLQVSHAFPYLKTRINVIKRWETVLTPLESACEDVKKKTMELHKAVDLQPPDVRMLQVNLQGAVLTSVNQGPLEVANTFLAEIPDDPTEWIPYNELRLSFKKFIYACSLALKKNKSLISSDQKEYQREMERNYNRMSEKVKLMDHGRKIVSLIRSHRVTNK